MSVGILERESARIRVLSRGLPRPLAEPLGGAAYGLETLYGQIHPEDREGVRALFALLAEGREPEAPRLFRLRSREGGWIWIEGIGRMLDRRPAGDTRVLWILRDVTRRRSAEERALRANRALRTLSGCNRVLVRSPSEEEFLRAVCRELTEEGGYAAAWIGLPGSGPEDPRPAAASDSARPYLARIRELGGDRVYALSPCGRVLRSGEGERCNDPAVFDAFLPEAEAARDSGFTALAALPLRARGEILGAISIYASEPEAFDDEEYGLLSRLAEDIAWGMGAFRREAARREAEERLRETDIILRSLLDALPDVVIYKAPDGRNLLVNRAYEELLGLPRDRIEGRRDPEFLSPERARQCRESDRRALASEEPQRFQEEMAGPAGTRFFETYKVAIRDEAGNPLGVLGVLHDVSERLRWEKGLVEALAEKDVLLREVHHRVKNNLQIVASLMRLQSYEVSDPTAAAALRTGERRVEAMGLLHEILYSGSLAGVDFPRYVGALVSSLLSAYGAGEGGSPIRTELRIEPIPLEFNQAIPCGLILNELIGNSMKYAFEGAPGGGVIRVEMRRAGPAEALLSVSDDGRGAPLAGGRSDSLGLKLVRALARQLDGEFDWETGPGGTSARVRFPLRGGGTVEGGKGDSP
jgi:PAS domain S-box-containing protein